MLNISIDKFFICLFNLFTKSVRKQFSKFIDESGKENQFFNEKKKRKNLWKIFIEKQMTNHVNILRDLC